MKIRLSYLALLITIPSVMYASAWVSIAKDVQFHSANQAESTDLHQFQAYNLGWDNSIRKFEATNVMNGKSLTVNEAPALKIILRVLVI